MIRSTLLVFVALSWPCFAEDTLLAELRAAVLSTQQTLGTVDRIRGASAQLTVAKHQLPRLG